MNENDSHTIDTLVPFGYMLHKLQKAENARTVVRGTSFRSGGSAE